MNQKFRYEAEWWAHPNGRQQNLYFGRTFALATDDPSQALALIIKNPPPEANGGPIKNFSGPNWTVYTD
ncbi:MAG: hypothetical protein LAO20_14250 [Acidobacteriia bacterium]|nr:hypothetical protein [Terriglobia bacterium]